MSETQDGVRDVLVMVLGIEDRAEEIVADTPLIDSLPELDSMAVVELMVALEERFDIRIDDADVQGDVFATLGTLTAFVDDYVDARDQSSERNGA